METNPLDPGLGARGPVDVDAWLRHASEVRRLARRLVRDDASADDLTQDAWLGVLERRGDHEPLQGWRRWLFGVTRNVARERRRSSTRRSRREQAVARPEDAPGETTPLERIETIERLARELSALQDPYRETLVRRYVDGLSFAEIGARMGASEGTVRSRHARGLALLRERLDRAHPGGRVEWLAAFAALDVPEPTLPHAQASGMRFTGYGAATATILLVVASVVVALWLSRTSATETQADTRAAAAGADGRAARDTVAGLAGVRAEEGRAVLDTNSTRRDATVTTASDAHVTLELVVVDERHGSALRDYHVRVGIAGAPGFATIDAVTNGEGRVRVGTAPRAGTLSLTLIDDARLDELRRAASGSRAFPWTIAVPYEALDEASTTVTVLAPVGPTVRIEPRFAPGQAEGLGRDELAAILVGAWVDLEGEDPVDPPRRATAPLRAAASASRLAHLDATTRDRASTPFARFGPDAPLADETSRRRIVLTSANGAWSGSAWLEPEIDELVDRGDADEGPIVGIELARVGDAQDPAQLDLARRQAASQPTAPEPLDAPWKERARATSSRTLKIRAFDAATGARLDVFAARVELDLDPAQGAVRSTSYGNLDFRDVPLEASVAFVVSARGYRPAHGTRADFVPDTDHDVALVRLVRGWQRTFQVTDGSGTRPIEGAHVVVDGERVGTTDARGELIVTRSACPTRVEVLRNGSRAVRDATRATEAPGTIARYYFED